MDAIRTQARHVRAGALKWYDTSLCGAVAAWGHFRQIIENHYSALLAKPW
jgi:hypothetical protein